MKTNFVNNFESANIVMNNTKNLRKAWHKEERTLSRLLRLAQEKKMMPYTAPIFEAAGIPTSGKVKPADILAQVTNFMEVKKEMLPAYLREVKVYLRDPEGKIVKDADGNRVTKKDADGNDVTTLKLTPIKEGTWTLEKLLKAVAK